MSLKLAHLTASRFFGGPERQMLGLACAIEGWARTSFLMFAEGGRCRAFLEELSRRGFAGSALDQDVPHLRAATRELIGRLDREAAEVLVCHGYKAAILGRIAARRLGIPVVAVSRGWTYENLKIRLYEVLDRLNLRFMDRVVCVSRGQAAKVRRAGVPAEKIVVIPNAIDAARFASPDLDARSELERLFAPPVRRIVGAAGRLSPEKGFKDLVDAAAALVVKSHPEVGFVLFGDGVLRPLLEQQIAAQGLAGRFVLAGFRPDLDRLIPALDLLVQSSYTEGMPNVILEACAAGVPVVATAVGGTPEILEGGLQGQLVPPGDSQTLSRRIHETLADEKTQMALGSLEREQIGARFTFAAQAEQYRALFVSLTGFPGGNTLAQERRRPLESCAAETPSTESRNLVMLHVLRHTHLRRLPDDRRGSVLAALVEGPERFSPGGELLLLWPAQALPFPMRVKGVSGAPGGQFTLVSLSSRGYD